MAKSKRFLVVPRTSELRDRGMVIGSGRKSFKGKNAMYIKDEGEAREIDSQYGLKGSGECFVVEDEKVSRHVRNDSGGIHNYFWGSTSAYRDGWERIFGSKSGKESAQRVEPSTEVALRNAKPKNRKRGGK